MEGKITGTGKRIMTMMLSVIMVTGIFAGMKLEVRAAKNYSIDLSDPGSFMYALQNTYYSDDTLVFTGFSQPPAGDKYIYIVRWDYIYNSKRVGSSITTCGENLSNVSITIHNDSQYGYAKLVDYTPPTVSQGPIQVVEFVFYIYYPFSPSQPTVTPPSQPGIDGLEEYQCMSCGMVKESQPIPASMATVKNLYGFIKDAPENGNVTIDFGKLHTISDYLLNKMSERSDVTVTISFEYQSAQYEITFPSGTDYSAVLEDEDTMYGYFGVAARLGLTVEAK